MYTNIVLLFQAVIMRSRDLDTLEIESKNGGTILVKIKHLMNTLAQQVINKCLTMMTILYLSEKKSHL